MYSSLIVHIELNNIVFSEFIIIRYFIKINEFSIIIPVIMKKNL